jgi:multidrug efflux pump subunit AcrA (membrane-fusion protein)
LKIVIWIVAVVSRWGRRRGGRSGGGRAGAGGHEPAGRRAGRAGDAGDADGAIAASGEVDARTKVSISARVSARIVELPYKIGDRVTKGDPNANPPVPPSVLVRLDSKDLEAQLRSVEARHAAERANVDVSRAQVARGRQVGSMRIMLADARRELDRKSQLLASRT